jgi:copper homeostasis protein CutC
MFTIDDIIGLLQSARFKAAIIAVVMLIGQMFAFDFDEGDITNGLADIVQGAVTVLGFAAVVFGWIVSDGIRQTVKKR